MKLTLDHPQVTDGRPVFIDDGGEVVPTAAALRMIRKDRLGISVDAFAELAGVSGRTVNGWEQGRPPTPGALFVLKNQLNDRLDRIRR